MEFILLILVIGLPMWAQANITSVIGKYTRVQTTGGLTGAQVAQMILDREGITDVQVVATNGSLTDNYNPMKKTVNLSQPIYGQTSIAAVSVAAHEVGHAIQHARGYKGLVFRNVIYPFARFGGAISGISILFGFIMQAVGFIYIGIIGLFAILLFQLATLPVEFNASARALDILNETGILNQYEIDGGAKVLKAAALTYLMAAISTFLNILRLLAIARRD